MNTVTYPYAVIMDGEIIPANTPIEVKATVIEEAVEENSVTEQPEEKAVTKNDTKRGRKSETRNKAD